DRSRRREIALAIETALAELPPELRAAFLLREYHGLEYAEIAHALQIALGTWAPMTPPAGFADRVIAAREATAPTARKRWPLVAGLVAAATAAAAIAFVLLRAP